MIEHSTREETRMNTEIQTIGAAVIGQTVIRYGAYIAIAWLVLTFADGWVMAWIGARNG
jgi:hypothetical protein